MGKRETIIRVVEFLCAATIGVILSQANWSKLWLCAPIVVFLALMVYDYKLVLAEKYSRVKGQLTLLMKLLPFESVDVRCTYHVPVWRKQLRQAFDYIPGGGSGGRKFSQGQGIIGQTFVSKGWSVENFENDAEYRTQMVQKYNYTTEQLKERRADRRSYFCYSLVDENHKVLGLIFFDASKPNTFMLDETDPGMKMIISACEAIKESLL